MYAFTVRPMNKEVSLKSGEVYEGSVTISNPADAESDFNYSVNVSPYSVVDDNYTADFVTSSDWSKIVDWIKIEEPTGTVQPNGQKQIYYTITVPEDAPAGGQYAVIGVSSNNKANGDDGVAVQNVFEMASIIYARVAGETRHEGEILSNSIPGFVTSGAPEVSTILTNSGNVHEVAQVTLTVKNALNGDMVFPVGEDENTFSELVMPESTRFVKRDLSDLPALGVFEVTQDVAYIGGDSEYAHNTVTMIVCPLWFLFLMILTVGAFIGTICGLIYKHRKKRRVF